MIGTLSAIGSDTNGDAAFSYFLQSCNTRTQSQVAAGIMGNLASMVRQSRNIIIVEPDTVRRRNVWSQEAQIVEVSGEGLSISSQTRNGLHARFGQMRVQTEIKFFGNDFGANNELVAAVKWDGGCDSWPDQRPIVPPVARNIPTCA